MSRSSARERARLRRSQQKLRSRLIWGGFIALVLGIVGFMIWNLVRPAAGESVPIMANAGDHVPEGSPPEYNSDPPTSGPHYGTSLPARFYQQEDLAALPPRPEGYLVHNLEHGHIIFWYNCEILDVEGCEELKSQIQGVMDEFNGVKVVAFPWSTIDEPLVMTSWGQLQRFESFDARQARRFVTSNRNRSPEPNAP